MNLKNIIAYTSLWNDEAKLNRVTLFTFLYLQIALRDTDDVSTFEFGFGLHRLEFVWGINLYGASE